MAVACCVVVCFLHHYLNATRHIVARILFLPRLLMRIEHILVEHRRVVSAVLRFSYRRRRRLLTNPSIRYYCLWR